MSVIFSYFLFYDTLIALGLVTWYIKTKSLIAKVFAVVCLCFVFVVVTIAIAGHIMPERLP